MRRRHARAGILEIVEASPVQTRQWSQRGALGTGSGDDLLSWRNDLGLTPSVTGGSLRREIRNSEGVGRQPMGRPNRDSQIGVARIIDTQELASLDAR